MLFSSTLVFLTALISISAQPTTHVVSPLSRRDGTTPQLPVGKTAISRRDMAEIARLASAVQTAYCPNAGLLSPPSGQLSLQPKPKRRRVLAGLPISNMVFMSSDPEYEHLAQEVDMSWYISHTPSTQTLTLAFSSLPSVDDTLELLASAPVNKSESLIPLPHYLFPGKSLPVEQPRIHHSYLPALETHGLSALVALLDLLTTAPIPSKTEAWVGTLLRPLTKGKKSQVVPTRHVENVGHGLGSAIGLLTSLALHLELSNPSSTAYQTPQIRTTLFGLPRVGNKAFVDWVDTLLINSPGKHQINRITSYADTIPHLPAKHLGLAHPSIGEIWIGADPRTAFACRSEILGQESEVCAGSVKLGKTSLLDHAGPFSGVWIGRESCSG